MLEGDNDDNDLLSENYVLVSDIMTKINIKVGFQTLENIFGFLLLEHLDISCSNWITIISHWKMFLFQTGILIFEFREQFSPAFSIRIGIVLHRFILKNELCIVVKINERVPLYVLATLQCAT